MHKSHVSLAQSPAAGAARHDRVSSNSSRPISQRRISEVPAWLFGLGRRKRLNMHKSHVSLAQIGAGIAYFVSSNSSRPINQRRISEVPAPISYSLASRRSRPVGDSLM